MDAPGPVTMDGSDGWGASTGTQPNPSDSIPPLRAHGHVGNLFLLAVATRTSLALPQAYTLNVARLQPTHTWTPPSMADGHVTHPYGTLPHP